MSKEELPSINDYLEGSDLPSYKDFLEKKEELPSVEEYISESNQNIIEEETQTIENVDGESFLEVIDVVKAPEWSELVRLVNDVRKNIPEIPEIKYYDTELCEISEKIVKIQENLSLFNVKSDKIYELDERNEEFKVKLSEIESKIPQVPEIKYYDSDIESIFKQIQQISEGIENLPEIKHYDTDIQSLSDELRKVKDRDVPDFRWIGNTFKSIDEDFENVQGHLSSIKNKIESEVSELSESISVKEFEQNINVRNLNESLNESIKTTNSKLEETKKNIYSELSKSSLKIWEYHREFKDDDKKLKKSILGEQNKLKQSLKKEIKEFNEQSVKTDETLFKFFNDLKVEVSLLPEVKYYDDDISSIKDDISSLQRGLKELNQISSLIKKDQKTLKENYLLNEPPSEKEKAGGQTDALTPLDQKFATLDDLSNHYRLFINRITTQLSTMGGGGAGFIKDLDDVDITGLQNNYILKWDDPNNKWVVGAGGGVGAGGTWGIDSVGIHTVKSVGINTTSAVTGKSLYVDGDVQFTGNLSVGGTITKEDIKNLDSIGIITARSGINVLAGGITAVGVVTATLFSGDGSGLTGVSTSANTVYVDESEDDNQNYNIIFTDENPGGGNKYHTLQVDNGGLFFNPFSNTLSVSRVDVSTIVGPSNLNGDFTVDGDFRVNETLRVRGNNQEFIVENGSGQNQFSIDSDNGNTVIEGTLNVGGDTTINGISTISTGVGTVHIGVGQTALLVDGNARVTGILTIGTGSITLDPNTKKITGVDEIIVGTAVTVSIKQNTQGDITFQKEDGKEASVGIGTTVSINTTGIITAAALQATTAFYPPIYTTVQRDAGSFSEGAMIYNSTSKKMEFFDGTSWTSLPGMSLGLTVALDG